MKVAIVLPYAVFGAAEDYAAMILGCGLKAAGVEVVVLHLKGSLPAEVVDAFEAAGVEDVSMSIDRMTSIRRLRQTLRSLDPDVVHVNQEYLPGMAAGALLRGTSVVVTAHNPALEVHFSMRGRLLRRWVTPRVDSWIVLSKRNALLLVKNGRLRLRGEDITVAKGGPRSLRVIPPGLPPDRFDHTLSREAARRQLGLPEEGYIVGTAGRLAPQKRHDLLIQGAADAAASIPDLFVAILGDGELRAQTARMGEELLPGRVRLLGHRSSVPRLLPAFDVFVLSSDFEGLPFALLEAMATGLPIITSDVQGSGEAIKDNQNGLLIPAGSAEAITDALLRVARDPVLCQRLGAAAHESFTTSYTSDRMIDETLALYADLLSG